MLPLLAGTVLAAALLAGCSGDGADGEDTAVPGLSPTAAATATTPAATARPTRVVPPPVDSSRPQVATTTLPPVPVGTRTPIAEGVLVGVDGVRAVTVTAGGPGETAGSAVAVTVTVRNDGARPVDLTGFTVTAAYGGGTPAVPTGARPAAPLKGSLATGADAAGTYVFRLPADRAGSLVVQVASAGSPNVVVVRR